jgi:hypothetical protein
MESPCETKANVPKAVSSTASPSTKVDPRDKYASKHRRMKVMHENSATYSDVEFRVGPDGEKVLGLKAIFARASEVFSKMFFEAGFRERTASPIVVVPIVDIEPLAFEQLRRWVYDVDIEINCTNVFAVLEAARKYMVEDLEQYCSRWIASTARSADGCVALCASAAANGQTLFLSAVTGRAESFGQACLASENLPLLPFDALAALLGSPDFCVAREEQCFEAAKAWANAAERRDEDPEAAWRLIVDEEVVRWHLMEPRIFAERVVMPGLLSKEEALKVFMDGALGHGAQRKKSLLGRLRAILCDVPVEEALGKIEELVELCGEEGYPQALAQCLVGKTLAEHEHCSEWVAMWNELWGALRVAGLRDECVRATVDYCQNLFEEEPPPDSLVGVWTCPSDTLGLVRILCKLNDTRKLAVLPLIKVLEQLLSLAEEGSKQFCAPAEAAAEVVSHLDEVAAKLGHLVCMQSLPALRERLRTASSQD